MTETRIRSLHLIVTTALAALLVLLLWPREAVVEADLFLPIAPEHVTPGLIVNGLAAEGVEVRLRGPRSALEKLSASGLTYQLGLQKLEAGLHQVPVNMQTVELPPEVTVVSAVPAQVTVRLEAESIKAVPVAASVEGSPGKGYMVANLMVTPETVQLQGPASRMRSLETIATKPIDVGGLTETIRREAALALPQGVETLSGQRITVEIVIHQATRSHRFTDLPVKGRNTAYAYTISPQAITITVSGPYHAIESLAEKKELDIFVDLDALPPGVYVRRATIVLPVDTTLVTASPEVFTITLEEAD
jgi:YbbR domain-containing protein